MKRLLPRPPRRRAGRQPGAEAATAAEVQPVEARPAVPAGAEPADPTAPPQPSFRNRGRLRRRMRLLRRVRELGYRDLGGLVFDQHRFGRPNEEIVRGKVAALAAVDAELRALEGALRERRDITELREPGLSACPRCGTLHGSDARYCPSCGLALGGARTVAVDIGEGVHPGRSRADAPALPEPRFESPEPARLWRGPAAGLGEPRAETSPPPGGAEPGTAEGATGEPRADSDEQAPVTEGSAAGEWRPEDREPADDAEPGGAQPTVGDPPAEPDATDDEARDESPERGEDDPGEPPRAGDRPTVIARPDDDEPGDDAADQPTVVARPGFDRREP